jgi:hypothetical protein
MRDIFCKGVEITASLLEAEPSRAQHNAIQPFADFPSLVPTGRKTLSESRKIHSLESIFTYLREILSQEAENAAPLFR